MIVWRKSSRSSEAQSADCVELAQLMGTVGIRDSKSPEAGNLALEPERFAALISRVKSGQLDRN